jgi:hypothetical protein
MSKQNAKSVSTWEAGKAHYFQESEMVELDHYFRDSENGEVNTGECNLHKYLKRGLYVTSLYSWYTQKFLNIVSEKLKGLGFF